MKDKNVLLDRLLAICEDYMLENLGFNKKKLNILLKDFKKKRGATEFAHTPSFFHLGIYRAYLTSHYQAQKSNTSMLFCINDHLDIKSVKEIRTIPFKNENNYLIAKPPSLNIKKKYHKFAIYKHNKPSSNSIKILCERILELHPKSKNNIKRLQDIMLKCSHISKNLADWFTNLNFYLSKKPCLVFPTSRVNDLFDLGKIYLKKNTNLFVWSHCTNCGKRIGKLENEIIKCKDCDSTQRKIYFPNVVLRQNLFNQLNVKFRICGRKKSYQYISDQAKFFTENVPQRINIQADTTVYKNKNIRFDKLNYIQLFVLNNKLCDKLNNDILKEWRITID